MKTRKSDLKLASPKTQFVAYDGMITPPPLFLHMFKDDVSLRVAPIGGRRFDSQFKVLFDGEEYQQKRARAVFHLLTDSRYKDVEAVVADSIKRVALTLLTDGVAIFEILPAESDAQKDLSVLHPTQSRYLYRLPFIYLQVVPRTDSTKDARRYSFVQKDRVWRVGFPRILGGSRGYLQMRSTLSRITGLPRFSEAELSQGEFRTKYDFSEFRRLTRTTVLRATRRWGWIGRDYSLDFETEFYSAYRQITFAWATATLREEIVREFNQLFGRLGIHAKLRLEGLLAPSYILEVRKQFASGEIDIAKAFERLKKTESPG